MERVVVGLAGRPLRFSKVVEVNLELASFVAEENRSRELRLSFLVRHLRLGHAGEVPDAEHV